MVRRFVQIAEHSGWHNPAHMPKRFGIGFSLAVITVVSIAFALLNLAGVPASATFSLVVLFAAVAAAQAMKPSAPRKVSVIVGGIWAMVLMIIGLASAWFWLRNEGVMVWAFLIEVAAGFTVFGLLLGYLAGGLIAGCFLLGERKSGGKQTVGTESRET